jgi:hypothetical protein
MGNYRLKQIWRTRGWNRHGRQKVRAVVEDKRLHQKWRRGWSRYTVEENGGCSCMEKRLDHTCTFSYDFGIGIFEMLENKSIIFRLSLHLLFSLARKSVGNLVYIYILYGVYVKPLSPV